MAVGLAVGAGALIFFLGLGLGIRSFVIDKFINDLPAEEIEVSAPEMDIGPLRLKRGGLFSSSKRIEDATIEAIKNMEIEAAGKTIKPVETVWRRMDAAFPVSAAGNLFGVSYGSDTALSGVDYGMVSSDVDENKFAYKNGDEAVPALVPKALLEMYNSSFAKSQNLPGMNPAFLIGKNFDLYLGSSSISAGSGELKKTAEIVGLTDRGALLGITVPIEYVIEWNRSIGRGDSNKEYTSLTVKTIDAKYVPQSTESIRAMGLRAVSSTGLAERVSAIAAMITAGLTLLASLILAVAGLNAWSLFRLAAQERRSSAGLWMALGAAPSDIKILLLAEAVSIGAVSGIIGSLLAFATGAIVNYSASRAADRMPIFPSQLSIIRFEYALLGVILTVGIALIAAYPSASQLAKTDPAEILADRR